MAAPNAKPQDTSEPSSTTTKNHLLMAAGGAVVFLTAFGWSFRRARKGYEASTFADVSQVVHVETLKLGHLLSSVTATSHSDTFIRMT